MYINVYEWISYNKMIQDSINVIRWRQECEDLHTFYIHAINTLIIQHIIS